ncbi:uncharacterized protein BXZ73DRAFT_110192 [Epithele typhae]|uniref:uncharacterized protein n=1 Tax=Epithele typhae TaxID=378194 RepID=UPI0020081DE9|nr:uncharacterized protein BXZ73DRAFT_110192 [Epithele typhae]KAH9907653.1 hypothetical protein BXZ73DRAFT_110192 [Epithele typhae]
MSGDGFGEASHSTWAAYMLWPFAALSHMDIENPRHQHKISTPATPKTAEDSARYRAHWARKSVLVRDGYRSIDAQISLESTLNILNDYCQVARSLEAAINDTDDPQNILSLGLYPRDNFHDFSWCLRATETPNCYEIRYMPDNERYPGCRPNRSQIAFVDHSVEFTALDAEHAVPHTSTWMQKALPNPELLRMHCALAHILHLSGAARLFQDFCISSRQSGTGAAAHVAPTGAAFMAHVVDEDPYVVMELRETLAAALGSS